MFGLKIGYSIYTKFVMMRYNAYNQLYINVKLNPTVFFSISEFIPPKMFALVAPMYLNT